MKKNLLGLFALGILLLGAFGSKCYAHQPKDMMRYHFNQRQAPIQMQHKKMPLPPRHSHFGINWNYNLGANQPCCYQCAQYYPNRNVFGIHISI